MFVEVGVNEEAAYSTNVVQEHLQLDVFSTQKKWQARAFPTDITPA